MILEGNQGVGIVAGTTLAGSNITNVHVSGAAAGRVDPAGLVGYHQGTITSSDFNGNIVGETIAGGLVAENDGGQIHKSSSGGTVTGNWDIGGAVGDNYSTVSKTYSTSTVTGVTINSAGTYYGGLVGVGWSGAVSDSWSAGVVIGDGNGANNTGGLMGYNSAGTVARSYSAAPSVSLNGVGVGAKNYGSVGEDDGNVGAFTNTYYYSHGQLVDQPAGAPNGITGLAQPLSLVSANYNGFDFATPIWKMLG